MIRMTTKNITPFILFAFCLLAIGCRKDLYYEETAETVNVHVTWPDSITVPEGVRVIFYPVDGSLPYIFNLKPTGSTVYVPSGEYNVLFFNNDTEYLWFQNGGSFSKIEAYTSILLKAGKTKGFPQQNVVNMPDLFYTYRLNNYRVSEGSLATAAIEAIPHAKVYTMGILIKIIGLKNVSSATGYLSGVAGSYFPGMDSVPETSSAIAFDFGQKNSQYISATARTFGLSGTQPQENIFRLILTLTNGDTKTCDFNITDLLKIDLSQKMVLSIPDSIVVEDVSGNTGSGFNATVEGWDETEIDMPM